MKLLSLKRILIEQIYKNHGIAFHVAEKSVRDSIIHNGLDPKKYNDDITTDGNKVYVFLDKMWAIQYAKGYNDFLKIQGEPKRDFDIWQININGMKLEKDYGLNSSEDPATDPSYCIIAPINKKFIKLIQIIKAK